MKVSDHASHHVSLSQVWWVPPTGIRSVIRLACRHLGLAVNCTVDTHTLEVVSFLRENGYQ